MWNLYLPKNLIDRLPNKVLRELQKAAKNYSDESGPLYKLQIMEDNKYVTSTLPLMEVSKEEKSISKLLSYRRQKHG